MLLERVEIVGFRGIRRLSLALEQHNVLIGENTWGKSSLLDALTLLLAPQQQLYHFSINDFWYPPGGVTARERHLHIVLTLREKKAGERLCRRYRGLSQLWHHTAGGYQHIIYRLEGELAADGTVMTLRSFLDHQGLPLPLADIDGLARQLVNLCPVLRLRDARFIRRSHHHAASVPDMESTVRQLDYLTAELLRRQQNLNSRQIRQGLSAIVQLLEHYFAEQGSTQTRSRLMRRRSQDEQRSWHYLDLINRMLDQPQRRGWRLILLNVLSTLLQARGSVQLSRDAQPLLLVEDPETRLHPIMLSIAWHLFNVLPLQKITTTNSCELLSMTPMQQLCRLVRDSDKVTAWRLGNHPMSMEDSRRIAFHIRFKRPSSLFARSWLLVEGETEVWMINELASQCGHHFDAEGVKVIEFAQSGLRPLIKFACHMGIDWHVLTDGDEAGKKYAAIVRSLLNGQQQESDHLTQLPAPDIECFMYKNGFAHVYHRLANLPGNVPINPRKVITKAIHRSSKPDLAIEVALAAAQRGTEAIPLLLRRMFSRLLWLARGRAD